MKTEVVLRVTAFVFTEKEVREQSSAAPYPAFRSIGPGWYSLSWCPAPSHPGNVELEMWLVPATRLQSLRPATIQLFPS